MTEYDVVIVGGGAAGLSAALVLSRARRTVLVIDSRSPRNANATHLHGFLTRDGMGTSEFLEIGRREVLGYGAQIERGRVQSISVDPSDVAFTVRCDDGIAVSARSVLVATGLRDELPAVPGVAELWGRSVLHCPYCHGHEVRDQPIGVLGGDNRPFSIHQASLVRQWSENVVFFPNGIRLDPQERRRLLARGVYIAEGSVQRVDDSEGDGLTVVLDDGRTVQRTALFVGPQFVPQNQLLIEVGASTDESGWIVTDAVGGTSVAGVWAAGNVSSSPAQIVDAASAGSRAAIAINHHLLEQDIVAAL